MNENKLDNKKIRRLEVGYKVAIAKAITSTEKSREAVMAVAISLASSLVAVMLGACGGDRSQTVDLISELINQEIKRQKYEL